MAENQMNNVSDFKDAVCIDAGRVYDSCCDRDCSELRVYFSPDNTTLLQTAVSVRLKSAEVLNVFVDVEQVSFNRCYYSCDLTYFLLCRLDVSTTPGAQPTEISGIASFTKKVILFGSEGNVKVFANSVSVNDAMDAQAPLTNNSPRCVVQTVEPVALTARIGTVGTDFDNIGVIPQSIADAIGGNVQTELAPTDKTVYVTLGIFSVIQLIRNVQMLIPVYDFCIPEKQCTDTTDEPCDVFRRLKFPTDDFFPPACCPEDRDCGC